MARNTGRRKARGLARSRGWLRAWGRGSAPEAGQHAARCDCQVADPERGDHAPGCSLAGHAEKLTSPAR